MITLTLRQLSTRAILGMTLGILLTLLSVVTSAETALDRYVKKDDGQYAWEFVRTEDHDLYTGYEVKLTSQQWLTENETTRPIWEHDLMFYFPKRLISNPGGSLSKKADSAIVYVAGGTHKRASKFDDTFGKAAALYNKIIIEVRQIPNEPWAFIADGPDAKEMQEDDLISRSFELYLQTGNEEWPLYLPMVKSVVKAMDASTEYLAQNHDLDITKFSMVGGSKRGWTTWLTAAVDERVIGIVPAIIDVLDIDESMENQFEAVGEYYPILATYTEKNLPCLFKTDAGQALLEIVDPIEYQDRLAGIPKLLLNGAADEFFQNTNSLNYWDRISEPKSIRFVPNAGHGLPAEAILSGFGFASKIIDKKGKAFAPEIFWEENRDDNTLTVYTSKIPFLVHYWTAENETLDFRLNNIGDEAWSKSFVSAFEMRVKFLDPDGDGQKDVYYAFSRPLESPETGFRGNMFTLNYGLQTYSTSIFMSPKEKPFEGTHCQ